MSDSSSQPAERGAHKYAILFFFFVVMGIVHPALPRTSADGPIWLALITFVLVAATYAASSLHRAIKLIIVLALVTLALSWLTIIFPDLEPAAFVARGAFYFTVTGVVFVDVLTGRTCGYTERLYGAAAVYLMVASACAQLYLAIDWFMPGAFTATPLTRETAFYFSLVTQTTLGYGDISPVLPFARSLAVMQATLGVLYIAILIARLAGIKSPEDE